VHSDEWSSAAPQWLTTLTEKRAHRAFRPPYRPHGDSGDVFITSVLIFVSFDSWWHFIGLVHVTERVWRAAHNSVAMMAWHERQSEYITCHVRLSRPVRVAVSLGLFTLIDRRHSLRRRAALDWRTNNNQLHWLYVIRCPLLIFVFPTHSCRHPIRIFSEREHVHIRYMLSPVSLSSVCL